MKARDAIGRRIVAVEQTRRQRTTTGNDFVVEVHAFVLDNGTRVEFTGVEVEYGDPAVEAIAIRRPK